MHVPLNRSKTQASCLKEDSVYMQPKKQLKLTNVLFGATNRSGKMIKECKGRISINAGLRDQAGGGRGVWGIERDGKQATCAYKLVL